MKDKVIDLVFVLYQYANLCKAIHYSCQRHHTHIMADEIRDTINEFADSLAEESFGAFGKPTFDQIETVKNIQTTNSLGTICLECIKMIQPIRTACETKPALSGIVSLIDDFKGKMLQKKYLVEFDKENEN